MYHSLRDFEGPTFAELNISLFEIREYEYRIAIEYCSFQNLEVWYKHHPLILTICARFIRPKYQFIGHIERYLKAVYLHKMISLLLFDEG